MGKLKTNKAAKKRYSLTASKTCENTIKKLLPYGG